VLLVGRQDGHIASLEEVRLRVEREASQAARDERFEQSIRPILDTYAVKLEPIQSSELRIGADNPS
jgi:hypothetical protein